MLDLNLSSPPVKKYYRSLPPDKTPWPLLDIVFPDHNHNRNLKFPSLIDSGASHSILHPDVAPFLNINLDEFPLKDGTGVGGGFKYWDVNTLFNIEIDGYPFKFKFHVSVASIPWSCILGENTIFSEARIDFQRYKGIFKIQYVQYPQKS